MFELPHKRPRNCTQSLSSAFNDVCIGRRRAFTGLCGMVRCRSFNQANDSDSLMIQNDHSEAIRKTIQKKRFQVEIPKRSYECQDSKDEIQKAIHRNDRTISKGFEGDAVKKSWFVDDGRKKEKWQLICIIQKGN